MNNFIKYLYSTPIAQNKELFLWNNHLRWFDFIVTSLINFDNGDESAARQKRYVRIYITTASATASLHSRCSCCIENRIRGCWNHNLLEAYTYTWHKAPSAWYCSKLCLTSGITSSDTRCYCLESSVKLDKSTAKANLGHGEGTIKSVLDFNNSNSQKVGGTFKIACIFVWFWDFDLLAFQVKLKKVNQSYN